jgi:excisionase family DNA binding protein
MAMIQLATAKEVAEKLQVSERTVQRLPIRFVRAGNQRRYEWADVERYLERRASRKKPST